MFYYLEVLEYAMKEVPFEEPNQGMIDYGNSLSQNFKLSSQSFITRDMNLYVQKKFNGNQKEFMKYARMKGCKG